MSVPVPASVANSLPVCSQAYIHTYVSTCAKAMVQKEVENAMQEVIYQVDYKIQQALESEVIASNIAAQVANSGDFRSILKAKAQVEQLCESLSNDRMNNAQAAPGRDLELQSRMNDSEAALAELFDMQTAHGRQMEERVSTAESTVREFVSVLGDPDQSLHRLVKRAIDLATETQSSCNKELDDLRKTIKAGGGAQQPSMPESGSLNMKVAEHAMELASEANAAVASVKTILRHEHADLREALNAQQANLEATLDMVRQGLFAGELRHDQLVEHIRSQIDIPQDSRSTVANDLLRNWEAAKSKLQNARFVIDRPQNPQTGGDLRSYNSPQPSPQPPLAIPKLAPFPQSQTAFSPGQIRLSPRQTSQSPLRSDRQPRSRSKPPPMSPPESGSYPFSHRGDGGRNYPAPQEAPVYES